MPANSVARREFSDRSRSIPSSAEWSTGVRSRHYGPTSNALAAAGLAADTSVLVKRLDPWHLVGLGTIGGGHCGASGPEFAQVHDLESIDVAEYHDYSLDEIPGDQWNGPAVRLGQARELGKPLMVGEMGVAWAEVGWLEAWASLVRRKNVT